MEISKRFQHILKDAGYEFASKKGGYGKHDYVSGRHTVMCRFASWVSPVNIKAPVYRQSEPKVSFWPVKKTNGIDWFDVKRSKRFLKKRAAKGAGDTSNPFFLYLSLRAPHPKFYTTKHWYNKIDKAAVKIPKQYEQKHPVMEYQRVSKNWQHGFDEETVRKTRAIYYAMISETDAMIGEVMDELKKRGLDKNTYVVVAGDHGENGLEHGMYYKMNMYESSAKVPLIIKGPGVEKGKIADKIVSTVDLMPTFLDMAGLETDNIKERYDMPFEAQGESLLPFLKGKTEDTRDWAFSMFTGSTINTSIYMIRKGKWKYIAYPGYPPQLFDLETDPDELDNLAEAKPEIVDKLDKDLREVVDYDEVHKKWVKYCRESLVQFKKDCANGKINYRKWGTYIRHASYDEVIKAVYVDYKDTYKQRIEEFINQKE